jgi:hypothetical protein
MNERGVLSHVPYLAEATFGDAAVADRRLLDDLRASRRRADDSPRCLVHQRTNSPTYDQQRSTRPLRVHRRPPNLAGHHQRRWLRLAVSYMLKTSPNTTIRTRRSHRCSRSCGRSASQRPTRQDASNAQTTAPQLAQRTTGGGFRRGARPVPVAHRRDTSVLPSGLAQYQDRFRSLGV